MTILSSAWLEQRVLLRTVTSKDAELTMAMLSRAGVSAFACASVGELVQEMEKGAGAVLIAEEAFSEPAMVKVADVLKSQSAWSDIPVLVIARKGADSRAIVRAMDLSANMTVIERPLRVASLVSWVRSALRTRERQYELRAVLQGLREGDQRKTEFLATLAHELRNPLAPLNTALGILTRKPMDSQAAQPYYEMMKRQVGHMVRLIDDLMEISRITRGKIELQLEVVTLDRIIPAAIELSRPLLDAAGHHLELSMPDGRWLMHGDPVRLTQVFSNLLNNAAKYTPAGGHVSVIVDRAGPHARVRVRDDGAGIPAEMLESIFGMFVQVSGTASPAQGGLGIGLTLVRSLVELHGGTVHAASAGPGKGSEVTVELPLIPVDASAPNEARDGALSGGLSGHVLVVDDNRDAADSLGDLLRTIGATAAVAYSASQALELASETPPSVAIVDIGMPGMDGCELAQRLRQDPRHAHLLLIALTGWGQAEDRARVVAAGFDHHFLKPLDLDAFFATLEREA